MAVPLSLHAGFLQQLIVFHKTNGFHKKVVPNFGFALILAIVAIRYSSCSKFIVIFLSSSMPWMTLFTKTVRMTLLRRTESTVLMPGLIRLLELRKPSFITIIETKIMIWLYCNYTQQEMMVSVQDSMIMSNQHVSTRMQAASQQVRH